MLWLSPCACALRREGWGTNIKRTYRIYRDFGLQLRNKTPKRRVKAKLRKIGRWRSVRTRCGRSQDDPSRSGNGICARDLDLRAYAKGPLVQKSGAAHPFHSVNRQRRRVQAAFHQFEWM